ncbi:MAG: hypothetical protein NZ521_08685, partial [Flammeovirgaceae bacterium]|nr:hypothetical protein [Flammeovirgaceae bacterium]
GNANGNTTSFSGASFPENYRVDIIFRARGNGTASWTIDRGVSSGSNTWNYSGDIGNCTTCDVYAVSASNTQRLEVRIKRSAIGTFSSLGIYVWLSNSSDNLYDSFPFGNRTTNGLLNINWGSASFGDGVSPTQDGYFDAQYQNSGPQNIGGTSGIEVFRDLRISGAGTTRKDGTTGLIVTRDLLIESGAIFSMYVAEDYLKIKRDLILNGTLTLSSEVGADVAIGRNFTVNTDATLTHNNREIIMHGDGEQIIGGSIATFPSIAYFAIDNSSSTHKVIVQKPFTITERIRLIDGILQTDNTNFITLGVSATVDRISSDTENYVDGPIAKVINSNTTFTFPVGNSNNYQPITIVTNSGSASTTFKASYSKSPYSNTTSLGTGLHHVSILEHWILDRTSGDRGGKVRLSWNLASDLQGYDGTMCNLSDLKVCRFNGTQWVNEGGSVISGSCSGSGVLESTNNITSFSPFTLGSTTTNNPLPVKLTYFKGERDNEKVILSWQTAIEHRNKGFEVERSYNGTDFERIGFVAAKGTGQTRQDYSFSLVEPRSAYYRLKQLDIDDKFEYSQTIFIRGNEEIQET